MTSRVERERRTGEAMVRLYCRDHHGGAAPCEECRRLVDYMRERLAKCPFQENKTTCGRCAVHCYRSAMREQVRAVMRYTGPRMLWRHPFLAFLHLLDGRRREPSKARDLGKEGEGR